MTTICNSYVNTLRTGDLTTIFHMDDDTKWMTPDARLRWARNDAGFSKQIQAVERFEWPASTYSAHESGRRNFGRQQAQIYAHAFRVNYIWLLDGIGEPHDRATSAVSAAAPTPDVERLKIIKDILYRVCRAADFPITSGQANFLASNILRVARGETIKENELKVMESTMADMVTLE